MNYEPSLRCEHCGVIVDPRTEFNACARCGCNPATGVRETGHTHIDAKTDRADEPDNEFADMAEGDFETFLTEAIDEYAEDNGAPAEHRDVRGRRRHDQQQGAGRADRQGRVPGHHREEPVTTHEPRTITSMRTLRRDRRPPH